MPATDGAARIHLIEDDPAIVQFVQRALVSRPPWRLVGHSGAVDTRQHTLAGGANVFLVDLGLPDGHGEALLRWLSHQRPDAELLVFRVFGGEWSLVAALQAGATGYVLKGRP